MRRIRPRFASLVAAFDALKLSHPDYEAILVGVTDSQPAEYLKEIPNADGYHQTTVGFDTSISLGAESDHCLAVALFRQLSRAILECPLAATDRGAVQAMLDEWARTNQNIGGQAAPDAEPDATPDPAGT